MVKVHYGEGPAIQTGPESCGSLREGVVEALTGVCAGQPLSGESKIPGADAVTVPEGNTMGGAIEPVIASAPSQNPGICAQAFCTGTDLEHFDACVGDQGVRPSERPQSADWDNQRWKLQLKSVVGQPQSLLTVGA